MVGRPASPQFPAPVRQPVAVPQDGAGAVIRLYDLSPPVQVDDPNPGGVEQVGHGRAQRLGADQGLPDPDKLPNVGQQSFNQCELRGFPATRGDGVMDTPGDVGPVRPVQAHPQAILSAAQV